MKKLLLVAATFLCSSSILSTYGAENCGDFRPTSRACYAMQSGGAEGLCKRTRFVLFQQVCSFFCSETGELMLENCNYCNDSDKEYPDCCDLTCERVSSDVDSTVESSTTPKTKPQQHEYTTPSSSHYFGKSTTTTTRTTTTSTTSTPQSSESDEDVSDSESEIAEQTWYKKHNFK